MVHDIIGLIFMHDVINVSIYVRRGVRNAERVLGNPFGNPIGTIRNGEELVDLSIAHPSRHRRMVRSFELPTKFDFSKTVGPEFLVGEKSWRGTFLFREFFGPR